MGATCSAKAYPPASAGATSAQPAAAAACARWRAGGTAAAAAPPAPCSQNGLPEPACSCPAARDAPTKSLGLPLPAQATDSSSSTPSSMSSNAEQRIESVRLNVAIWLGGHRSAGAARWRSVTVYCSFHLRGCACGHGGNACYHCHYHCYCHAQQAARAPHPAPPGRRLAMPSASAIAATPLFKLACHYIVGSCSTGAFIPF